MRKIILFLFLVICAFPVFTEAQKTNSKTTQKEFRSPFRYVIIAGASDLEKYVNRFPNESLDLEVLLENDAFNEKNLRELFTLLSNRYNSGQGLSIWVYTSLSAVRTPEENEQINLKGPIENYSKFKNAFFFRDGNKNEWFKYSVPNSINEKLVVLKGCYKCP